MQRKDCEGFATRTADRVLINWEIQIRHGALEKNHHTGPVLPAAELEKNRRRKGSLRTPLAGEDRSGDGLGKVFSISAWP